MGGNTIIWEHLFWIFGHPEVYILILPAFGVFSEILPTFQERDYSDTRRWFCYRINRILGFMVWAHHMFTTGLGPIANAILLSLRWPSPFQLELKFSIGCLRFGEEVLSLRLQCFTLSPLFRHLLSGSNRSYGSCSTCRLSISRFLFYRCSLPLRYRRRCRIRYISRCHILVAKNVWQDVR